VMMPILNTPITRMLDIRYPVLAGGMMWLSDARFVAAVSRAGGLGFMTARSHVDAEAFEQALRECEQYAKGAPYGVNLTLSAHTDNTPMLRYLEVALAHGVRRFETAGMPPPAGMIDTIHRAG